MLKNRLTLWLTCLVVLAVSVFQVASAFAADRVTLKNGSVVEGTIVREAAGVVWIKQADGTERMLLPSEITNIARGAPDASSEKAADAAKTAPASEVKPATVGAAAQQAKAENAASAAVEAPLPAVAGARSKRPKAAVITLGGGGDKDMVGIYMTEHALKTMMPMLEEELGSDGSGIVVFRINSGGGYGYEVAKLSDYIHNEYKKRFKVVGWIEWAISAAAMTSHCIEDIYFTTQGAYGACTGWSGNLVAVKGIELVKFIEQMKGYSARGNHDPRIMESMQIMKPLSVKFDGDRPVFFHDLESGDFVVNGEGRILTLDARMAERIRFSRGTADTLEELTKAMGYSSVEDVEWIGERKEGYLWPICRAEKWNMEYRGRVHRDETQLNLYRANFNRYIAAAEAEPLETRGKFVTLARAELQKMRGMVKNNPNFALFEFGADTKGFNEWADEVERRLREMMKPPR